MMESSSKNSTFLLDLAENKREIPNLFPDIIYQIQNKFQTLEGCSLGEKACSKIDIKTKSTPYSIPMLCPIRCKYNFKIRPKGHLAEFLKKKLKPLSSLFFERGAFIAGGSLVDLLTLPDDVFEYLYQDTDNQFLEHTKDIDFFFPTEKIKQDIVDYIENNTICSVLPTNNFDFISVPNIKRYYLLTKITLNKVSFEPLYQKISNFDLYNSSIAFDGETIVTTPEFDRCLESGELVIRKSDKTALARVSKYLTKRFIVSMDRMLIMTLIMPDFLTFIKRFYEELYFAFEQIHSILKKEKFIDFNSRMVFGALYSFKDYYGTRFYHYL